MFWSQKKHPGAAHSFCLSSWTQEVTKKVALYFSVATALLLYLLQQDISKAREKQLEMGNVLNKDGE